MRYAFELRSKAILALVVSAPLLGISQCATYTAESISDVMLQYPTGVVIQDVKAADLDQDGFEDLLVRHNLPGETISFVDVYYGPATNWNATQPDATIRLHDGSGAYGWQLAPFDFGPGM